MSVMARARRPFDKFRPGSRDYRRHIETGATLRRFALQFEVNDQAYFLNYVEDEGLWYVFRPTGSGVIRIPVEMEAVHSEHFAFAPEEGKKRVVH
jgi:hypothetical protein